MALKINVMLQSVMRLFYIGITKSETCPIFYFWSTNCCSSSGDHCRQIAEGNISQFNFHQSLI